MVTVMSSNTCVAVYKEIHIYDFSFRMSFWFPGRECKDFTSKTYLKLYLHCGALEKLRNLGHIRFKKLTSRVMRIWRPNIHQITSKYFAKNAIDYD